MSLRPSPRRAPSASRAIPALLVLAACGDSSGPSARPEAIEAATLRALAGVVGEPVDPAPAVRVLDGAGRPIPGVTVEFSALAGGSVTGAQAKTGADGVATVGSWTLGTHAGAQSLVATVAPLTPIRFTATAAAGAPATLAARGGIDQIGIAGTALPIAPTVRLQDAHGNAIAGATVTFEVTEGDGSVTGESVTTNALGDAIVGSWTLGPAEGVHVLTARIGTIALPILARAVPLSQFDIDVVFLSQPSVRQRLAIERAVARWRKVIIGDAPDIVASFGPDDCGLGEPAFAGPIDDVRILVEFRADDGPGGTLAYAGPCAVRVADGLTVFGGLVVDRDDASAMESSGQLEAVVQHEMGHVFGIGTLWYDHVVGAGGPDPYYTGASGLAAFAKVGGAAYTGFPVPVENIGGGGTRDGHWRESAFDAELMTGFAEAGGTRMPLSLVTIGALEDLGYAVTPWGDDAYRFGVLALRAEPGRSELVLRDHPLPRPTVALDATGRRVDPRLVRPRAAVQRRVERAEPRPVQLLVSPR